MISASLSAFALEMDKYPIPVGPLSEMTYTSSATRFALWSPMASEVVVNLYNQDLGGLPVTKLSLQKGNDGVWSTRVMGDKQGFYYTFQVRIGEKWLEETPGIFAKAVGTNGQRAMVMDMRNTDPQGWNEDKSPEMNGIQDVVVYEMHHRDFSVHSSSGIKNKGKFVALTENGTKTDEGLFTGIDHLKELGVTHVHLLPSYDFGSIDETTGYAVGGGGRDQKSLYNWGYDPVNYNVPEGSYSTNAANPSVRIKEFKQMVKKLHEAGIRVVLDVVYNHVFDLVKSNFQRTVPNYFFRWKEGKNTDDNFSQLGFPQGLVPANGSGCGNETASDMPMMRKYMVESVLYWMKEYHIDGFRFDLMGIHDMETMGAIRQAAQTIDPNVFIYGEGWAAENPAFPKEKLAMKENMKSLEGIAAFGDEMRDGLRGGWQNDKEGAFLIGNNGYEESLKFGIVGAIEHPGVDYSKVNYSKEAWASEPTQMISYVSCHDDMCLADRIRCTLTEKHKGKRLPKMKRNEEEVRLHKLAETTVLTSQGVPFIWCGDEIMRNKKGVHNSYASPDSINAIDWALKSQHKDVFDYVSTLVKMRKQHPAFHMGTAALVRENLSFIPLKQKNVVAFILNGKAVGDEWNDIIVVLNANEKSVYVPVNQDSYTIVVEEGKADVNGLRRITAKRLSVAPQSAMIIHN